MSRQLRNFNDSVSISNWANGMIVLKSLLLPRPSIEHPTKFRSPPQLTLSRALGCTQMFSPPPEPIPIKNSSLVISPKFSTAAHVGPEIKPQLSKQSPFKRRRVSPRPKKPHPPLQNFPLIEESNISTSNLGACKTIHEKGATVKLKFPSPIIDKSKPFQSTGHITREDTDPHALPKDKEFQEELACLMRDAAQANMKWEDYINANGERYQRCTRYFFYLSDDFVF